jgi:hypothetical protein
MSNDTAPATRFAIRNLSVLAYTNGFTSWVYKAGRATADQCCSDGFFNDASDMVAVGDTITIVARDGVRMVSVSRRDLEAVAVQGMV